MHFIDGSYRADDDNTEVGMFIIKAQKEPQGCHLAQLIPTLLQYAPEGAVEYHKSLNTIRDEAYEKIDLVFADGSVAQADAGTTVEVLTG